MSRTKEHEDYKWNYDKDYETPEASRHRTGASRGGNPNASEHMKEFNKLPRKSRIDDVHNIRPRHRAFLEYWLETGEVKASAIKAGYSPKTATSRGCTLLKDPRSQAYIEELRDRLQEKQNNCIANTQEIMEYLTKVMRGEEKDAFGLDPSLQDRTKAALELNRIIGPVKETKERVVIVDGIVRNNQSEIKSITKEGE